MNRWKRLLWPALATLAALGLLLSLGTWQLRRLHEKEAVLFSLNSAATARPVPLAADGQDITAIEVFPVTASGVLAPGFRELTRVTLSGTFMSARSVPVRATLPSPRNARSVGGLGFFWMTPLRLDNGQIVFINRGFVPAGPDGRAPAIETPVDSQTITGLIRLTEKAQTFTPADNPARGEYFIRDPKVMAQAVGLSDPANFFVDAERTSADALTPPVGIEAQEMIARIPNNHLQYAVTWFGFALTLVGVFGFFARAQMKDS
jgi:surfeit locus 1 family protein